MFFQNLMSFWSTVRVRFPIKESKLVAVIGDSVILVCSAEGYPLDIEWKKNEPGSTAVIKRKIFWTILEFHTLTSESSSQYVFHFHVRWKAVRLQSTSFPRFSLFSLNWRENPGNEVGEILGQLVLKDLKLGTRYFEWCLSHFDAITVTM